MQAFGQIPFTVAMLHSRLITMRNRLVFTPIYALLSENGGNSITLCPLPDIPRTSIPELPCRMDCSSEQTTKKTININKDEAQNVTDTSLPSPPDSQALVTDTRVLLAVSVTQEARLDLDQWAKWLTISTPYGVTKVDARIESVYKSHSSLVLISVPISTWNLLPERPAYKFVGFIRSHDLAEWKGLGPVKASEIPDVLRCSRSVTLSSPANQQANPQVVSSLPDNHRSWTLENDEKLKRARREGLSWGPIASKYFPSKTANACRKRHERLMEKAVGLEGTQNNVNYQNTGKDHPLLEDGTYADSAYGSTYASSHMPLSDLGDPNDSNKPTTNSNPNSFGGSTYGSTLADGPMKPYSLNNKSALGHTMLRSSTRIPSFSSGLRQPATNFTGNFSKSTDRKSRVAAT